MSVYAGPEYNESGVVFHYDMNNKKSYVGAPTTNHVPNADTMPGWTTYGGSPVAFQTEFGTTGYRLTNAPSWNGLYRSVTVPSTGTYTFSAWIRYLGGSPNNNGGTVYISGWGGSDTSTGVNKNIIGQWQRISRTITVTNTSMTFYIISYGGTNDGNSDRSSWEITMPQLEAGSVATTFVNGTRSTAQAVIDLTGKNTVTASNITWNSNTEFSWASGVDARLQLPSSSNFAFGTGNFSIECWIKPTAFSNYLHIAALPDQNTFALKANTGDGQLYFYSPAWTSFGSTSGWTLTLNSWNHVIFTRSSSVGYAYLNGNLIGSKTGFTNNFTAQTLNVGNGFSTEFAPKQISTLKIYNRALSTAEVYSNFNAQRLRYGL